jgi:hypothetical protein
VAWVCADGRGVVDLFEPSPTPAPDGDGTEPSVLALAVFDSSGVDAAPLALVHPHGSWIDFPAPAPTNSVD